jgi:hypothetical protein
MRSPAGELALVGVQDCPGPTSCRWRVEAFQRAALARPDRLGGQETGRHHGADVPQGGGAGQIQFVGRLLVGERLVQTQPQDAPPDRLAERSPCTHAAAIRAPLLLIHGSNDTRVELPNTSCPPRNFDPRRPHLRRRARTAGHLGAGR